MRKRWRMTFGSVLLCTALASGCVLPAAAGETEESEKGGHRTEQTELTVFAAASMTETLTKLAETYEQKHPEITISFNFDSSGTLETQILEGSDCDLFVSAAQKQMNELDKDSAPDTNPDNNDELLEGTRTDLLENKVALAVPDGNPKNIRSFDDLADDLKKGSVLLAMGNSDVPVGQYTQKILAYYGLSEDQLTSDGCITYGSNVKEVTVQVSEASVDCGIIYQTDAFSAKLTVVDTASADMCGQVIYPAAVLKNSAHPDEAKAFLAYLQTPEAQQVFEEVGFTPIVKEMLAAQSQHRSRHRGGFPERIALIW